VHVSPYADSPGRIRVGAPTPIVDEAILFVEVLYRSPLS
jgi:hypothetical protein